MEMLRKITEKHILVLLSLFSAFLLYVDYTADWKTSTPALFRSSILLSGEYGRNGQADLLESSSSGSNCVFSSSGRRQDLSRKNRLKILFHIPCPASDILLPSAGEKKIFFCRKIFYIRQVFNRAIPPRAGPFSV
ncbi:MAG: hypothetical protein IKC08_02100 [Lentisphaeria bacterium]|nr:hypothetical protein [Lentisphaeria bacterium]